MWPIFQLGLVCYILTRNKNKNGKNLKIHICQKISKGRRSIRKSRYFYQPNDLVKYNKSIYTVKGAHNNETRVILKETGKSIKIEDLTPYSFSKGFYFKTFIDNKFHRWKSVWKCRTC